MAKIPKSKINEIKSRINIVDVVSQYVRLKKRGKNHFGLCPFHSEDTPSFSVNPQKNIYHCFGCNKGGDVIDFVMEYENLEFFDAVKQLATQYGIDLELQDQPQDSSHQIIYNLHEFASKFYQKYLYSEKGKKGLDYLRGRGFSDNIIKKFSLGMAPDAWEGLHNKIKEKKISEEILVKSGLFIERKKGSGVYDRFRNRVMFPIKNISGRVIGFGGRALDSDQTAKYINSPQTPIYNKRNILYGLDITNKFIRETGEAIVVEGYTDLIKLYEAGIKNITAGSGTAFTEGHVRILKRYCDRVKLCYDGDTAGQKAAIKTGFKLLKKGFEVYVLELPEKDDPDSYLQKIGSKQLQEEINNATEFMNFYIHHNSDKMKTSGKKVNFVDDTVQELAGIKNPVVQELVARKFADKVGVEEKRILNQLDYQQKKRNKYKNNQGKKTKKDSRIKIKDPIEKAEQQLIRLLLSNQEEVIEFILSDFSIEEFNHQLLRKIGKQIVEEIEENSDFDPKFLLNEDYSKKEKNYISRLLMEEEKFLESHELIELLNSAADCLEKIWKNKVSNEAQNIRKEIKEKEKNGKRPEKNLIRKSVEKEKEKRQIDEYLEEKLNRFISN